MNHPKSSGITYTIQNATMPVARNTTNSSLTNNFIEKLQAFHIQKLNMDANNNLATFNAKISQLQSTLENVNSSISEVKTHSDTSDNELSAKVTAIEEKLNQFIAEVVSVLETHASAIKNIMGQQTTTSQ